LDDGYFGSGRNLIKAFKKYGKENFKKEILEWFDWRCEGLQREAEIVNDEFVNRKDTYNLKTGGEQNILYSNELKAKMSSITKQQWLNEEYSKHMKESQIGKYVSNETKLKISNAVKGEKNPFYGKAHSEEFKNKMSELQRNNMKGKRVGINHPLFGKTPWNKGLKKG
jgi:group I intron endonuclease